MRILAQFNKRERTALVVCVAFIAATLLLSFVEQFQVIQFARSVMEPDHQRLRYTGTIVIPEQTRGQCRFMQFDNKTSEIRHTEVGECFSKPGVNSPYGRMDSLRDAFKR